MDLRQLLASEDNVGNNNDKRVDPDDLGLRLPPLKIIPATPQAHLTVVRSEPSQTCPHGLVRYLEPCGKCWEQLQRDAYGWVIDSRFDPWRPEGTLCVHQLVLENCPTCWARCVCSHKKERRYCNLCGGSKLCIACRKRIVKFVGATCKTCQALQEGRKLHRGPMPRGGWDPDSHDELVNRLKAEIEAEALAEAEKLKAEGGGVFKKGGLYEKAFEERKMRAKLLKAIKEAKAKQKMEAKAKKREVFNGDASAAACELQQHAFSGE